MKHHASQSSMALSDPIRVKARHEPQKPLKSTHRLKLSDAQIRWGVEKHPLWILMMMENGTS